MQTETPSIESAPTAFANVEKAEQRGKTRPIVSARLTVSPHNSNAPPRSAVRPLLEGDRLLTDKEAAKYIGVSPGTLPVWRSTKRYGLSYLKIGRSVRYRLSVLDAWLDARTRDRHEAA